MALGIGAGILGVAAAIENRKWLGTLIMSLFVSGCVGTTLSGRLTHHSSAQDYFDKNESNILGPCVKVPACRDYTPYCASVTACAQWEVHGEDVYGRPPTGTLEVDKPIWIKGIGRGETGLERGLAEAVETRKTGGTQEGG